MATEPKALTEFVKQEAAQLDPSDETTLENKIAERVDAGLDDEIDARIKPYARTGSTAKAPFADLESAANLDVKNHDTVSNDDSSR